MQKKLNLTYSTKLIKNCPKVAMIILRLFKNKLKYELFLRTNKKQSRI